tara:strand:- start:21906 stop:22034 length:129 start_codon:yes stop_codon:yes gene_type:complete
MEYTDLEGRIRRLQCLLDAAIENEQLGMVVYYRVMIDELRGC